MTQMPQFPIRIIGSSGAKRASLFPYRARWSTRPAAQSCWETVRGQPRPTVFLDLSGVMFLASGALGSLVSLHRWLTVRGHQLRARL